MVKTKFMKQNRIITSIEKKYGVKLKQKDDDELVKYLKKQGYPSLAKLLKMTVN